MNEKINEEKELPETSTSDESLRWNKKKVFGIGLFTITIVVGIAFLLAYFLAPSIASNKAEKELNNTSQKMGEVQVLNSKVSDFNGVQVPGAVGEQKMLTGLKDGAMIGNESGVFIFSNGKDAGQKVIEVYVDFSNQNSRDFLLLNLPDFKKMIEGGVIDLHIIPVPTGDAFTMYSAETIAKTISNQPERAWDLMVELLKLSAVVSTDKPKDLMEEIIKTSEKADVDGITKEVIGSGSFASWIIATSDDQRLKVGYYPPVIYIDGKIVDQDAVNINDKDALRSYIMKR